MNPSSANPRRLRSSSPEERTDGRRPGEGRGPSSRRRNRTGSGSDQRSTRTRRDPNRRASRQTSSSGPRSGRKRGNASRRPNRDADVRDRQPTRATGTQGRRPPHDAGARKRHPTSGTGIPGRRTDRVDGIPGRRTSRANRPPRRQPNLIAIGAAIVAIVAVGALFVGLAFAGQSDAPEPEPESTSTETPATLSTPVDQWRQGEYPELYQTDEAWASEPYAAGTIETHGCGPTALATVYVGLTGKTDQTPATIAKLAEDRGYVVNGETTSALMTDGAADLGLSGREFPVSTDELMTELEAGHPVIANMKPGEFTTTGHYIALVGLDDQGDVIIRDPNSPENSHRTWKPFELLRQANYLWTYEPPES